MKFSVSVPFRNGLAHYSINQEGKGVFLAQLEQFEGPPQEEPPANVILTKSVRRWRGSSEDQTLIDHLGQAIEDGLLDKINSPHKYSSTKNELNQPAKEA